MLSAKKGSAGLTSGRWFGWLRSRIASALNAMGRSEESSRRKPTADLGGSPSGLQEGDRITRSVLEFGRCATDSGEPLVCIVTSSLKNVASPRSVDAPTAPYGKSRAYNAGFHGLSPSGVCLQANWENSGNYDWGFSRYAPPEEPCREP